MLRTGGARSLLAIVLAGVAAVACQSGPAPSDIADPRQILAAAVTSTSAATTVRVDATAGGKVALDLLGLGTASTVELDGTTASADLDLAGGDARVTFSAPGLLGVTGELIALHGTTYLKSTLTGALYHVSSLGPDIPTPSGEARASVLKGLTDLLVNPRIQPVKGDDAPCGSSTCYTVTIALSAGDLAALGAGNAQLPAGLPVPIQLPELDTATVDLTILVAKDTTRLADLKAAVGLGAGGSATVELTFSKWDEPVSVVAPPPDQLAPAG